MTALRGSEVVDVADIDKDGDDDYIYLMDNSLYIKYTTRSLPSKIIDHDISISSHSLDSAPPTAVNYFSENTHESGYINLDFSPAHPDDSIFRLEFYDHMLEWDSMKYASPDSSQHEKTTIDLIVDTLAETRLIKPHITTIPIHSYIAGITSPSKTVRVFTPSFTEKIPGDAFALSPGRVIYTGDSETQITYKIGTNQDSLILPAHSSYSFDI